MDIPKSGGLGEECRSFRFGICYFLQLGCLFLLNAWLPIDPYYNQLIAMAFYTVINFIFNKVYTFKE